jgi:hypothetical protein
LPGSERGPLIGNHFDDRITSDARRYRTEIFARLSYELPEMQMAPALADRRRQA